MKVDAALTVELADAANRAAMLEAAGYDGVFSFEGNHDPFVPLTLAATTTTRVELTTAIAVAFARNPMTLANVAYDLQLVSRGRFVLGLGSQIRTHIEKRFSMPWSHPAARMREMVLAIRAIWSSWQEGTPLRFEGEFYRHTLMTPFFNPGPNPYGLPRILLAGVGPLITEVAGEVADGLLVHPFTTEAYLREVTWPALRRGLERAGRTEAGFEVAWPIMVVTGDSEEAHAAAESGVRARLAFYGSTPAYRPVLDLHGWGDLQPELNRRSKAGDWAAMAALISDEMVDALAIRARPDDVAAAIGERAGGLVTRVSLDADGFEPTRWADAIAALHTLDTGRAGD